MRIVIAATFFLLSSCAGFAQSKHDAYRVDYALHEVEQGKRINTRNFSLLLEESGSGNIRMGNKIPVQTSGGGTAGSTMQYIDVGLTLECRLQNRDGILLLDTRVETNGAEADQGKPMPVIRQMRATADTAVTPGKPMMAVVKSAVPLAGSPGYTSTAARSPFSLIPFASAL